MRRAAILLAAAILSAPAWAGSEQSGVWTYTYEPSSSGKGGIVTALSPSPSPSGDPNDPSYLVARCINGRAELLVGGAGGWGVPHRQVEIATRIDDRPSETRGWDVSTNGKAAFLSDGAEAFLKTLPDDGKLLVTVLDAAGERHETVFRTTGFGAVREKIADACGWPE